MADQDDRVWRNLVKKLRRMRNEPHARVGVFGDATKAAAHEYGAPKINLPERSFIRLGLAKAEREQKVLAGKVCAQIILGRMTLEKALRVLGEWGSKEVKKTITEQPDSWPPLSDARAVVKARQKKNKILVDTGELINSITYEISQVAQLTDAIGVFATGTYTVTRTAVGGYTNGRYAAGATSSILIEASVQPATGRDLAQFPEAFHSEEKKVIYTATELKTQDGTNSADRLTIGGLVYSVVNVTHWEAFDGDHYIGYAVATTVAETAGAVAAVQDGEERNFTFTVTAAGTSHLVTIPSGGAMTDASYTGEATITHLPSGPAPGLIEVSEDDRTTTSFYLDLSCSVPIGTMFDIHLRDAA